MAAEPRSRRPARSKLKAFLRALRLLAVVYLGVVLVFLFFENWLIYHPTKAAENWGEPTFSDWEDVNDLTTSGGIKIHAWWCPRQSTDGVLLFCHGNAGNISDRAQFIPMLQTELGVSVLIFDYPGYGKSDGNVSEQGCYAAAEAAFKYLTTKKNTPPEKIILLGNSLGGGVATHLAEKNPHRALILSKTFTSLPDVGQRLYPRMPVRLFMRNQFPILSKLPNCRRPVILVHGQRDGLVPFDHAEQLYRAANEPKMFYTLPEGDHNTPLPVEFFQEAKRFLEKNK